MTTLRLRPFTKLALLLAAVTAFSMAPSPVLANHNPDCGKEYIYYRDSSLTTSAGYKYIDCDCNVTIFGQITPYYELNVESCW